MYSNNELNQDENHFVIFLLAKSCCLGKTKPNSKTRLLVVFNH